MASFVIQITASAEKDLDAIPAKDRKKVLKHLMILEENPFTAPKIKKLKGKSIGTWRLEVWPYRVRYDIEKNVVIIYRIRHRKDIYKD